VVIHGVTACNLTGSSQVHSDDCHCFLTSVESQDKLCGIHGRHNIIRTDISAIILVCPYQLLLHQCSRPMYHNEPAPI
jgi:hypothetical protein